MIYTKQLYCLRSNLWDFGKNLRYGFDPCRNPVHKKMSDLEKKQLTAARRKEDNICQKLKDLARERQYGTLTAEIKIHEGFITEIRHRDFVGVIR